jgi:hypothetical protein
LSSIIYLSKSVDLLADMNLENSKFVILKINYDQCKGVLEYPIVVLRVAEKARRGIRCMEVATELTRRRKT